MFGFVQFILGSLTKQIIMLLYYTRYKECMGIIVTLNLLTLIRCRHQFSLFDEVVACNKLHLLYLVFLT